MRAGTILILIAFVALGVSIAGFLVGSAGTGATAGIVALASVGVGLDFNDDASHGSGAS